MCPFISKPSFRKRDRVPHQSLLAWGSSLTHCKSVGKDYLNAKMLRSNRSSRLPHKRPNVYCYSQRSYTHPKAPHANKSHASFCSLARSRCCALLPGSLQAGWFMYAYFCSSVWFFFCCKSLDNSFLCQKYKCKTGYLKKTPPVATSSLTKAATGCVPRISGSISLFDGVFVLFPTWLSEIAFHFSYNAAQ